MTVRPGIAPQGAHPVPSEPSQPANPVAVQQPPPRRRDGGARRQARSDSPYATQHVHLAAVPTAPAELLEPAPSRRSSRQARQLAAGQAGTIIRPAIADAGHAAAQNPVPQAPAAPVSMPPTAPAAIPPAPAIRRQIPAASAATASMSAVPQPGLMPQQAPMAMAPQAPMPSVSMPSVPKTPEPLAPVAVAPGTVVRPAAAPQAVRAQSVVPATFQGSIEDGPATMVAMRRPKSPAQIRDLVPTVSSGQLTVAGLLGLVTIASPLSGAWASASVKNASQEIPLAAMNVGSAYNSGSVASAAGLTTVRVISPSGLSAEGPGIAAVPSSDVLVAKPSRDNERSILPGCSGEHDEASFAKADNGKLPDSMLCTLWQSDRQLRADAAIAAAKLNLAYRAEFGHNLSLVSDYRTYSEQAALYKQYGPGRAARPGRSSHGLGLAIDLKGVRTYSNSTYLWLREHAATYGWENPDWAVQGGSGVDEPWHWEYFPGVRGEEPTDELG